LAAAGIAFTIVALLFADIPYRMQDRKEIDVTGHMVCLPHKQGIFEGGETLECAFGFKGDDGRHFAIGDLRRFTEIPASSEHILLSGIFTYGSPGSYEKDRYDVVGSIQVSSWTPAD
jgi:hypothetical protein